MRAAPATDEAAIEAAVREAWRLTLPEAPDDPGSSWAEAGGDSLEALHLVLRLEARLGRRVPPELIGPETTIAALARRLAAGEAEPPRAGLPVFIVPGFRGHAANWASLRRALADVAFETAAMPDLESRAADLADLCWTAARVADDVARRRPAGPIVLAGYSFGACVAHEAARRLAASGRDVAKVVLLDPWVPDRRRPAPRPLRLALRRARELLARDGEGPALHLHWLLLLGLWHGGAGDAARRLLRVSAGRLAPGPLLRRREHLLRRLRLAALRRWTPRPLDAPVLLAVSDEQAERGQLALWRSVCPQARLLRLPGRHRDVLAPAAAERLVPPLRAALAPGAAP